MKAFRWVWNTFWKIMRWGAIILMILGVGLLIYENFPNVLKFDINPGAYEGIWHFLGLIGFLLIIVLVGGGINQWLNGGKSK